MRTESERTISYKPAEQLTVKFHIEEVGLGSALQQCRHGHVWICILVRAADAERAGRGSYLERGCLGAAYFLEADGLLECLRPAGREGQHLRPD